MFPFGRPEYRTLKWEMPYTRCEVAGLKLRGAAGKDAFPFPRPSLFPLSSLFMCVMCMYMCICIYYIHIKVCMHACVFFFFTFFSLFVYSSFLCLLICFSLLCLCLFLFIFSSFSRLYFSTLFLSLLTFFKTSPFSCSLSQP